MINPVFLAVGVLTSISVSLLVYALFRDGTEHPLFVTGLVCTIVVILAGWVLIGGLYPCYKTKDSIPPTALEIQHMSDRVVVKLGDTVEIFTDVKTYDLLSEEFVCTLIIPRNMYGFPAPDFSGNTLFFYPVKDSKDGRESEP